MNFLRKIHLFGYKRAFVYLVILVYCKIRTLVYKLLFSDNVPELLGSKVIQSTQYVGKGKIRIVGACLGVWPSPLLLASAGYIEARAPSALVEIKESTFINNSFVIIADKSEVRIGERCLIGPNFFVTDSDFHGLDLANRSNGKYDCASVVIEDDVFIGDSVRILKGVRVGYGSVIGSGSLVTKDVDSLSVYAGVPARKIKSIT